MYILSHTLFCGSEPLPVQLIHSRICRLTRNKYQIFRKLDHLSIYFLIAGTYTPFCLVPLNGPWGWSIFGVIWGLAVLGITLQAFYINVWRWLTTAIYVLMGWVIVVASKPLLHELPLQAFGVLLAGGILYTIGGVFYTLRKPNLSKYFGYHELWHALVLIASICHWTVIFFYLALA